MKRWALGAALVVTAAIGISGSAGAATFRWANDADSNSMDPYARQETFLLSFDSNIYEPLVRRGTALLDTVMTYLEQGNSLEATARLLFVHANTVRYRLRRVSELTGAVPGDGRGGFSLWVAVVFGRLAAK